jgi:hypothetical protein
MTHLEKTEVEIELIKRVIQQVESTIIEQRKRLEETENNMGYTTPETSPVSYGTIQNEKGRISGMELLKAGFSGMHDALVSIRDTHKSMLLKADAVDVVGIPQ